MSGEEPRDHSERIRHVAAVVDRSGLTPGPEQPCAYLAGRTARYLALAIREPAPGLYHAFMDLNFRRSGLAFYRPACQGCAECRSLRVAVTAFRPSRAQRRCWARNADLHVTVGAPAVSAERIELYGRYLAARHDGLMEGSAEEFERFLGSTCLQTIELSYRVQGRLVAAGLADVEPRAMSAVYCYFEPNLESRSLGVFNVLRTIEECRRRGLAHLYLGYYVRDSAKMRYKAAYRPNEILDPETGWRPTGRGAAG